jgi:hypothetical protein
MNDVAANPADELKALQEQLALQQQFLLEKEAQLKDKDALLSDKDTLLNEHATQLEHKQLLLDESNEHIAWLEETVALLQSKRFRHSSEKLDALQGQLFDESEMDASINEIKTRLDKEREAKHTSDKQALAANRKPEERPRRKPLPDHLRRMDIDVDVSSDDKHATGDE